MRFLQRRHLVADGTPNDRETTLNFTRTERSRRNAPMRRLIQLTVLALCLSTMSGCILPIYSARPERRVQQLLYTSEDLRSIVGEWERFWFLNSPSHMTPIRTHGGVF